MKKLVIIDGKSVFYRGYYAMGALSTSEGVPTGGIYGFAVIALELVKRIAPNKVVVAWDKAGTSIRKRKELFSEYKAGRVKPPEDFYAQIPLLKELVEVLNWEWLECDDYEADDIIGSLALQAKETDEYETLIISSDLDMLQVVDERTKMFRLLKGFSELEEIEIRSIEERYGILKEQFLDLKALKGDASDNIPGVPGIGEKTAVKLLGQFGSLRGIYENLEKIEAKAVRKKLELGKESAEMSYKLAKIMTDAPVMLEQVREFQLFTECIVEMLEKLEFRSLIKRFFGDKIQADEAEKRESGEKIEVDFGQMIVDYDIKQKMHEDERLKEEIFGGKKFWDLNQGQFLLNPLAREREIGELKKEYLRQQEAFAKLPKLKRIMEEYDLPAIPVLFKMEERGIKIDQVYFARLEEELTAEILDLEKKIGDLAGENFNLNSPIQLSQILFEKLGLPTKGIKKKSRGYSTGAKELEKLKSEHEIIGLILEYREMSKLLGTYVKPMMSLAGKDGRIRTTFTQDVTATGRLSSVMPNLQNIPVRTKEGRRIRRGFVAEEGKVLVSADYSQFELRLAAVLADDQKLMEDFEQGIDIHTKTAAEVFGIAMSEVKEKQRRAAKVINFGVLYGMSAKGLADAVGMEIWEAKKFIEGYFKLRQPIREYLDKILVQAREQGFVETYYGRRRPTPDVKSTNFLVRMGAERAAQNMPIQGTEADLMKRAMIKVDEKLPKGAGLILQVHDSLIVECEEDQAKEVERILKTEMEGVAPELKVKLAVEVKVGRNWGEL